MVTDFSIRKMFSQNSELKEQSQILNNNNILDVINNSSSVGYFFKIQQFIICSMMADCGSYNIATLNRTETREEKRKEKKEKKEK